MKPQDITSTALFTIEGELDDISGSGQTKAAHALCKGVERREGDHLEVKGAGHYGIFSGRRWRNLVYPQVRDFIAAHAAPGVATSGGSGATKTPTRTRRAAWFAFARRRMALAWRSRRRCSR